jgi:two-component system sensor histidine kinase/response regulator
MTQHDIKNPLSAVIAGTDMLLSDSSLSERQTQIAQAIRTHAWHSIDLLNQSLRLYRMESGTFVLQQEQVDLVTMLMRVRQETLATFADLKLDIRMIDADGGTPELNTYIATGEEGLCYSLFGNLMRNAAEASPQNGSIHIQFSTEPKSIVVAIRNSGMVPRTIRDRFFDKYVTAGKPDGSGLGTYTARLVTEAQNGTIAMSIDEDNGTTTLTVRLPTH